jgi:chromosome partitioning protein
VGSDAETADARAFIEEAGFEVLAVALPEKVAYRLALSSGRSLTETRYPALNKMAVGLLQDIIRKVA